MNTVFLCIRSVRREDGEGIRELGLFGIATDQAELDKLIDAFLIVHGTSRDDAPVCTPPNGWSVIAAGLHRLQWHEITCNKVEQAIHFFVKQTPK